MSAIETVLRQPAAQVVGWALLHFIWQGALIGTLTAIALAALRRSAADVRYVVATIALSLMLTLPVVTALQLWSVQDVPGRTLTSCHEGQPGCQESGVAIIPTAHASDSAPRDAFASEETRTPVASTGVATLTSIHVEPWLPALVLGWLCGVALLTLRLMSGWLWVQRMKSYGTVPAGEGWQRVGARLSRRLHIARHVRLLESTLIDVPTVIGWMKPVVLLPTSALAGLTPEQLEAILAHELAHIRRHDYLVNLLQTLVETLLFYHPAVWWLSRRIRAERENCCDDLAVSLCGDPFTYAKALADLEELRGATAPLALAANGGSLALRVRRLLGAPTHAGRKPGWLAGSALVLLLLGIAAGASGIDGFHSTQPSTPPHAGVQAGIAGARSVRAGVQTASPKAPVLSPEGIAATREVEASARVLSALRAATSQADAMQDQARAIAALAAQADDLSAAATAALARASGFATGAGQSHGTFTWSNKGEKLNVKYDGDVEFTDDDTDVRRLSPGGLLRIRDGGLFASRTIEFSTDPSGAVTRRFWVGMSEKPFEPEGRQWLAKVLPRFIRQTGLGAPARVARILKAKGPAGVLAEIALIEGSWAKRTYFSLLLKTSALDSATVRQVLTQAGREVDSDFELASLLIDCADKLLLDEPTRRAYIEAARSIQSDFEMRRVYASVLKRGPVSAPVLAAILDASHDIESDFEEASLLIQIAKLQPLDSTTRPSFFAALATVGSDFLHHRVLSALAERTDLAPETIKSMLDSIASVKSDFESASFLLQIARQQPIEGALRAPFFRGVDSIGSSFERGRVLEAVVRRGDASPDTVLAVLRATVAMNGSFEASQVLLAVAAAQPLTGAARDAYIDAAEKLGDFQQGKVLAALVRSERRR
jgi:beta-lactamase regulating signal transducer with metallopeptidase domain